jgi:hypothetical protein
VIFASVAYFSKLLFLQCSQGRIRRKLFHGIDGSTLSESEISLFNGRGKGKGGWGGGGGWGKGGRGGGEVGGEEGGNCRCTQFDIYRRFVKAELIGVVLQSHAPTRCVHG